MSGYTVVRDYPYPIEEVWHVLTDPHCVSRWTSSGRSGRPEGYAPVPGTDFRFVGRPVMGWAGIVYCHVVEVDEPTSLHYTWRSDEDADDATHVTYLLGPVPGGTRFTWDHTGFTGAAGFAMSRLLGSVRRKMLTEGVPLVLADRHRSL